MGWYIKCTDSSCNQGTYSHNIVDLIDNHTDSDGWFQCRHCKAQGYIEKRFELQEKGATWEPYLKGIIKLGILGDTYQPFIFLVGYEPDCNADSYWFSYYKDLRKEGGKLKLGYGPGGPPVLSNDKIIQLIKRLLELNCIKKAELKEIIENISQPVIPESALIAPPLNSMLAIKGENIYEPY